MKDQLIEARALIANIEHWTQGDHAVDDCGVQVDVNNPAACAWCADGAILRVAGDASSIAYRQMGDALSLACRRLFPEFAAAQPAYPYVAVNDGELPTRDASYELIHSTVLEIFDDAIAHA